MEKNHQKKLKNRDHHPPVPNNRAQITTIKNIKNQNPKSISLNQRIPSTKRVNQKKKKKRKRKTNR
jgi:hypothetical protein